MEETQRIQRETLEARMRQKSEYILFLMNMVTKLFAPNRGGARVKIITRFSHYNTENEKKR